MLRVENKRLLVSGFRVQTAARRVQQEVRKLTVLFKLNRILKSKQNIISNNRRLVVYVHSYLVFRKLLKKHCSLLSSQTPWSLCHSEKEFRENNGSRSPAVRGERLGHVIKPGRSKGLCSGNGLESSFKSDFKKVQSSHGYFFSCWFIGLSLWRDSRGGSLSLLNRGAKLVFRWREKDIRTSSILRKITIIKRAASRYPVPQFNQYKKENLKNQTHVISVFSKPAHLNLPLMHGYLQWCSMR